MLTPYPGVPAPRTWPLRSPSQVYADDLNKELSSAVQFLANPPQFYGSNSKTPALVGSSGLLNTSISLDTYYLDNYLGGFQGGIFTGGYQFLVPGVYLMWGSCPLASGSATSQFCAGYFNASGGGPTFVFGSQFASATGRTHITPAFTDLYLETSALIAANDNVGLVAGQNTGATINTYISTPTIYPVFGLRWVAGVTGTNGLTWPSPRTWAALDQAKATYFNSDIRNAVRFLTFKPYTRAIQTSSQTIPNNAWTTITGLTVSPTGMDNYSAFASNTWTCPVAGTYLFGYQVAFLAAGISPCQVGLNATLGGVTNRFYGQSGQSGTGQNCILNSTKVLRCAVGDTVQVQGYQNTGAGLTSGASTRFFALALTK